MAVDTVIFDTDVLVWAQRGSVKALDTVSDASERAISVLTYMELLQGARNSVEFHRIREFVTDGQFRIFPLTENIGHRALVYVEEYALSHGLRADDAIIASTAIENSFTLVSSNHKHYRFLNDLKFRHFKCAQ